ncbi:hypothetical protein LP419_19010 [Massilia sp. H-1]|nr:hypothetical protein LP419_19010 [Massilia sp. H-1]
MRQLLIIPALLLALLAPPGATAKQQRGGPGGQGAVRGRLAVAPPEPARIRHPDRRLPLRQYPVRHHAGRRPAAASPTNARCSSRRARSRDQLSGQNPLSWDLFIYQKEQLLRAAAFYPFNPQPLTQLA